MKPPYILCQALSAGHTPTKGSTSQTCWLAGHGRAEFSQNKHCVLKGPTRIAESSSCTAPRGSNPQPGCPARPGSCSGREGSSSWILFPAGERRAVLAAALPRFTLAQRKTQSLYRGKPYRATYCGGISGGHEKDPERRLAPRHTPCCEDLPCRVRRDSRILAAVRSSSSSAPSALPQRSLSHSAAPAGGARPGGLARARVAADGRTDGRRGAEGAARGRR